MIYAALHELHIPPCQVTKRAQISIEGCPGYNGRIKKVGCLLSGPPVTLAG